MKDNTTLHRTKWYTSKNRHKYYELRVRFTVTHGLHNLFISSNIRSNVLKLNIFYEELNYETIREERSYEVCLHFFEDFPLKLKRVNNIFSSQTSLSTSVLFYPQLANFVSDLGGSLGLWIGMSVLSFAEVLELLLLISYALFRKFRRKLNGKIRSSSFHGKGKGKDAFWKDISEAGRNIIVKVQLSPKIFFRVTK